MNKAVLFASMGMLAVATSTLSLAGAREDRSDMGAALLSGQGKDQVQLAWDARQRDERADREPTKRQRPNDGFDHGMQAVPNHAGPGQPGDGWLYFSHPAAHRAVVISPQGAYYLSQGKGLRLVSLTQPRS